MVQLRNVTSNQASNQVNTPNSESHMMKLCDMWLNRFAKPSSTWSEQSSYYFKHLVERYYKTYISNEAFIKSASKRYECRDARHAPRNKVFKMEVIDTNSLFNNQKI